MKLKKRKTVIGLCLMLLSAVIIPVVIGQILCSLSIPVQMKLKTTENVIIEQYQLELRGSSGITNLNFGEFNEDETKKIYAELHNTGNTNLAVYWHSNVPSSWHLDIIYYTADYSNPWPQMEQKPIAPSDCLKLQFWMTEINAVSGQTYSFEIVFEASA